LKRRGFSRAVIATKSIAALAAEGGDLKLTRRANADAEIVPSLGVC
jgi:hypothetical protein